MPAMHALSETYVLSTAEIGLLGSPFEMLLAFALVVAAGMAATLLARPGDATGQ